MLSTARPHIPNLGTSIVTDVLVLLVENSVSQLHPILGRSRLRAVSHLIDDGQQYYNLVIMFET